MESAPAPIAWSPQIDQATRLSHIYRGPRSDKLLHILFSKEKEEVRRIRETYLVRFRLLDC